MTESKRTPGIAAIRRYVEMRRAQPLLGLGDSLHTIHSGTDYEADVRFSDLESAVLLFDELQQALTGLVAAVVAEVNEKGGGGYILARLSDARAAIATAEALS